MKELIVTIIIMYFFWRFCAFLFETWSAKAEAKNKQLRNRHY